MRAAAKLCRLASGFDAEVTVSRNEIDVGPLDHGLDAVGGGAGASICVRAEGAEAAAAAEAIAGLVEGKLMKTKGKPARRRPACASALASGCRRASPSAPLMWSNRRSARSRNIASPAAKSTTSWRGSRRRPSRPRANCQTAAQGPPLAERGRRRSVAALGRAPRHDRKRTLDPRRGEPHSRARHQRRGGGSGWVHDLAATFAAMADPYLAARAEMSARSAGASCCTGSTASTSPSLRCRWADRRRRGVEPGRHGADGSVGDRWFRDRSWRC